jgi:bifunctional DNase/RNase
MIQVRVVGIALDSAQQRIVLLKPLTQTEDEGQVLPIWVGDQEATSILIAVEGGTPPRPLTHDLMKTLIDAVDARVDRIEVTRLDDGIFYAEITLATPRGKLVIDARPSDSVALAVRVHAPMWVAEDVMEAAGIPASLVDVGGEEAELDDFKKFLENVDPEDFQG